MDEEVFLVIFVVFVILMSILVVTFMCCGHSETPEMEEPLIITEPGPSTSPKRTPNRVAEIINPRRPSNNSTDSSGSFSLPIINPYIRMPISAGLIKSQFTGARRTPVNNFRPISPVQPTELPIRCFIPLPTNSYAQRTPPITIEHRSPHESPPPNYEDAMRRYYSAPD
ncbi:unnamed protein product [Chironomus riparius]|uniref:Uncharacterized protein n=1 Tax=Chironomus riparius TaxID=315576 RepID=A0A9N9WTU7_9DIPT|nr:unnamed protein product [Chironomus riparius]